MNIEISEKTLSMLKLIIGILISLGVIAGGFMHVHDDFKRMQLIQELHDEVITKQDGQIRELQLNLTKTYVMISNVVATKDKR